MLNDPAEQFTMTNLPGSEGEYHARQFLLCVVQLNAVQGEKDQTESDGSGVSTGRSKW